MSSRAIVLFDGRCAFCRKSVSLLRRLDWLGRFDCRDARDVANLPPCGVPLDPQRFLEEMHVVTPDGKRTYAGYRAVRWIAWRLPLLWPLAPFLHLPGAVRLGSRIYRWIARNRFKLVPCRHGVCTVPGVTPLEKT
jgi:predicted DCC family thiol-disulfide oxidoreductase YuxK